VEASEQLVFIVIAELDASGKSTQSRILASFLRNVGRMGLPCSHPSGDCYFGLKARQFLHSRGKGAHFAAEFFYALDVIHSILLHSWQRYDYTIFVRYLMGKVYVLTPLDKIAYFFFSFLLPIPDHVFFQARRRRTEGYWKCGIKGRYSRALMI
jgi:thymidylate kinase